MHACCYLCCLTLLLLLRLLSACWSDCRPACRDGPPVADVDSGWIGMTSQQREAEDEWSRQVLDKCMAITRKLDNKEEYLDVRSNTHASSLRLQSLTLLPAACCHPYTLHCPMV